MGEGRSGKIRESISVGKREDFVSVATLLIQKRQGNIVTKKRFGDLRGRVLDPANKVSLTHTGFGTSVRWINVYQNVEPFRQLCSCYLIGISFLQSLART